MLAYLASKIFVKERVVSWYKPQGSPSECVPELQLYQVSADTLKPEGNQKWAFRDGMQSEEVELCVGLEEIEMRAFSNCESLRGITIPSTVRIIGTKAFSQCKQLWKS